MTIDAWQADTNSAARAALGALYLGAGALVNAIFLATGVDYADFADSAHVAYVHDTWRSAVAPNQDVFITLLVIFEALVGALILSGGRRTQAGLWCDRDAHRAAALRVDPHRLVGPDAHHTRAAAAGRAAPGAPPRAGG